MNLQFYQKLNNLFFQEILALTGGGKTREYTEVRPDGTTVTYTIDVEEEVIEVNKYIIFLLTLIKQGKQLLKTLFVLSSHEQSLDLKRKCLSVSL